MTYSVTCPLYAVIDINRPPSKACFIMLHIITSEEECLCETTRSQTLSSRFLAGACPLQPLIMKTALFINCYRCFKMCVMITRIQSNLDCRPYGRNLQKADYTA